MSGEQPSRGQSVTDLVLPLDYARPQKKIWPVCLALLGRFCRAMIVIDLYALAAVGVWFTIDGIINFFHPLEGMVMFRKPVTTTSSKIQWLVDSSLQTAVFLPLAIWHVRRLWRRRRR